MFRKLVSNLPYSPALISELGFYTKRLRKEEVTRQTTILFVVLTLIMQSLAVFSAPESANAASEQDIIRGGVSSLDDFLIRFDHNEDDIKDIYTTVGVNRAEIEAAREGTISAKDNTYVMSRYGQLSASADEVSVSYQGSAGGAGIRYFSPMVNTSGKNGSFSGWIGQSAALGWFAIVKSNGSLATHGLPTSINPADATITSTTKSVVASNLTQNFPAVNVISKPLDKISYTLKQTNNNTVSTSGDFSVRIADITDYATLIDGGGGTFDAKTKTISWPRVQLQPGTSQERTFVMQLFSTIPATGVGQSNPASYDCMVTLSYGNIVKSSVECPSAKGIEGILYQMPPAGIGLNIAFSITLTMVVLYFFIRTRQLRQEVRIIRHDMNTGII